MSKRFEKRILQGKRWKQLQGRFKNGEGNHIQRKRCFDNFLIINYFIHFISLIIFITKTSSYSQDRKNTQQFNKHTPLGLESTSKTRLVITLKYFPRIIIILKILLPEEHSFYPMPNIPFLNQLSQPLQQFHQLSILPIMIKRQHRHPIKRLQHKANRRVINQNRILQPSINHSQILKIIPFLQSTMITIQPMRKYLIPRIQIIEYNISVRLTTSCKYYYLCYFRKLL